MASPVPLPKPRKTTPKPRKRASLDRNESVDAQESSTKPQVETREDEEQNVKLQETVDLLLAAGYFRARIKGLSPFDKVVGGMTWCITTCNIDIDVDLLFQENSTIGQKIALTEKIVAVLPRMKCPHRLEPHQIQGLDFIHIFPVVQWLVKRAIETREEMGDYIRAFSISQFNKNHTTPEDDDFNSRKEKYIENVSAVKKTYQPKRRYKRNDSHQIKDEETRVQSTLLEYGRKYGVGRQQSQRGGDKEAEGQSAKVAPGTKPRSASTEGEDSQMQERRIKALMRGMDTMEGDGGRLSASAVGSIVGMQSDEIQQIASEYADRQAKLATGKRPPRLTVAQQHNRTISHLNKQFNNQQKKAQEVQDSHEKIHKTYLETQQKLQEAQKYSARIDQEMEQLEEKLESEENKQVVNKLESLVALNDSLKKQEQEFRAYCKEEMGRLQADMEELKKSDQGDSEEVERNTMIDRQHNADKEKLHKARLVLARKNREIAVLQRKIDEVPSRSELAQYQQRFVELYNQIAATHKETKQFYTLYNTLTDTKLYLEKEVNLLNSIHDNFTQAMSSSSNKNQYLRQFEQIVEGIKQNKIKVTKKRQEEKMRRDQLNDNYLDLVEKQRLYFKTVKEFKEECGKNEVLLSKLKAAGLE